MRLKRLSVTGITRFEDPVDVNFDDLPSGLIAVSGPNGAGKTTLLELSGPGTLFRELPTRSPGGTLSNWKGKDGGSTRLVFELGGSEYISEVLVDKRGSMTAFLTKDGSPIVSGKVRDYDAKISEIVGPKESFLVSVFGAQGGRGRFSSLKVSERKSVFRYYLGLDRVEALHKKAAELATEATRQAGDIESIENRIALATEELDRNSEEAGRLFDQIERSSIQIESLRSELESANETLSLVDVVELYDAAVEAVVEAIEEREEAERKLSSLSRPDGECPDIEGISEMIRGFELKSVELRASARESFKLYSDAMKNRDELRRRASLLSEVPCEGEGEFSACPLLADARDAKVKLSEILPVLGPLRDEASRLERESDEASHRLERYREIERESKKEFEIWSDGERTYQAAAEKVEGLKKREQEARDRALSFRGKLPKERPSVEGVRERAAEVRFELREAESLHDETVRRHASSVARGEGLESEIDRLSRELDEKREAIEEVSALTLLKDALGPNGVQAFEIDAAGPRVSELANDLLRSCYGERFTVSVSTLKEKKGGGFKEDFAIQVVDSERGPDRDISGLSGGEQVIVDEALRTALSLFASERNALPIETLWRDETVGALDGENAARYVQMLQRARKIGGFDRVVYVTHDEKAIEGADAVIKIDALGKVTT